MITVMYCFFRGALILIRTVGNLKIILNFYSYRPTVCDFQAGGRGSIPGGIRNFNFYTGTGSVSFVCVLSCVVSGGGPDVLLTTHGDLYLCIYLVFWSIVCYI